MPTATPADVRVLVDTSLEIDDVADILDVVARDVEREYGDDSDVSFADDAHRADFEAALAAFRIVTGRDRDVVVERRGEIRIDYETTSVGQLKARVTRLDPGTEFTPTGGVVRDADRYVRSVTGDE